MHDIALDLALELMARPSVTPDDAGCQDLIARRLEQAGFTICNLPFGEVSNLWATHGQGDPLLVLAGHTDVVPSGPEAEWQYPPFIPRIEDGRLIGRGAADMKGSLGAMVTAAEQFVAQHPDHKGTLAFLLTSDEEGPAVDGTVRVVEWLKSRNIQPTWCIVGEPSSSERFGDTIKNGRRGSLGGRLVVEGIQGHVAYPHLARNPVHEALPALDCLARTEWDNGNAHFPPTSFQISNIHGGTGATNVIPGSLTVDFNFRFSTESTAEGLKTRTHQILAESGLEYDIHWQLSGQPFLTHEGALTASLTRAIKMVTGIECQLSTAGGTSDGRFIAPMGVEVVELGPCNQTIHQLDESVPAQEIGQMRETLVFAFKELLLT
jgi:succinyl-diaminopimelate desuccinylase